MLTVFDVAKFILKENERSHGERSMTTWKLQKLVYYTQAWSTVWDDAPLFPERIEAWANGPVCRDLYDVHKGKFTITVDDLPSSKNKLNDRQKKTVMAVLIHYGGKTAHYLSELSHREMPWKEARKGLSPGERGNREIPLDSMAEYYGGLYKN
jgi:uncharacterized phage-associated protein